MEEKSKEVQEIVDTLTKELREHIDTEFIGQPNDEETRKKMKEKFKKYFDDLGELIRELDEDE